MKFVQEKYWFSGARGLHLHLSTIVVYVSFRFPQEAAGGHEAIGRFCEQHFNLIFVPLLSSFARYTWVIRSRLDIAWMLPLPPLSQFSPSRVYAGHNFFPLADQFLLVPRRFAQTLFGAVRLCYDCKALQVQRESGVPAQTEGFLRMVLRGEDGSNDNIPFGYYEFPVVIVRSNEGGVCEVLHPLKIACELLRASGYMVDPLASTEDGDGQLGSFRCMALMGRWYRQACVEMFPPLIFGTGSDPIAAGRDGEDAAGMAGKKIDDGGGDDEEHLQRMAITDHRSEPPSRGEAMTFEEATRRVEGIHRDLSDLLGMMRVDVAPRQERWTYYLAHHYPFHQVNPLNRAERGPLDEVAIIEGYRLSEADFNRLVPALSCFLSDTAAAVAERGREGKEENIVVLKTTAAEEERLQALVNCSTAESLHDVWMALLKDKFEPSETVCRGPIGPCLERLLAETGDS